MTEIFDNPQHFAYGAARGNTMERDGFTSLQKQTRQLRLLNQLSTGLQGLMEAESFYTEIVDLIQKQLSYYSVHIWSVGSDSSATLRAQAGAYLAHLNIGHTFDPNASSITSHVVRTKKSYLCNDVTGDPNFTSLSIPVNTRSQLCVPVLKGCEVIAAISIESESVNAFNEEEVLTLEAVAGQIAVAISNRKVYREVKDFNRKLQLAVEEKTRELMKAHERILKQQELLEKENKALKTLVQGESKENPIIGQSKAMIQTLTMVDRIAPTHATVLIQGESGTGKEQIARRLHLKSERAAAAFITVNCGALQESLLESELFGHERGAFTGAVQQKIGLAEAADGGTLFMDEIGEMSLPIQAKMLRFLQEGEFYRIGGKRPIHVNVRIISATNRSLEDEVKAGRFREDLYYRLNTILLTMPPLRERREDIPLLIEHFLKNPKLGGGVLIKKVEPGVIEALAQQQWAGNIRELQNTIERMKILSENNEICMGDLPFQIQNQKEKEAHFDFRPGLTLEDIEKNHILKALSFHQGNKTKTAQSLGVTIKTLYNKLQRYDLPA